MAVSAFVTARDRVVALADANLDLEQVLRTCLRALHDVAEFGWAALLGVDPDSILPVSGVIEGYDESACAPFWELELAHPGYLKFADLARSTDPVGTLFEATDGELSRAPAYVQLYSPMGAADELRAAFVLGSSCWGIASLVRPESAGPFTVEETTDVRHLVRFIARALRAATLRTEAQRATRTAVVVFDRRGAIVHATADGRALLDTLRGVEHVTAADALGPGVLRALIARARCCPAGSRAQSRFRDVDGAWYQVSAAATDARDGTVAVVIEPASNSDLLTMILESHGLTAREIVIVRQLARGRSSVEIAGELSLSPHTVRDHVKAILHKCGVASRGELVALLFADQQPTLRRAVTARA